MDYKLKIHSKHKLFEYIAKDSTNLLVFLQENGFEMYTPCNGKGTCGKCKVKISNCVIPEPSSKAHKVLGGKAVSEGYRLSCQTLITSDMEIFLDETSFKAKVLTDGKEKKIKPSLLIYKKFAAVPPPNLEDQRSDSQRISDFLSLKKEPDRLDLLRQLPGLLRKDDFKVTLVLNKKRIIGIEDGDTTNILYGIAIDIGTTTIAAYLLDMITGERLNTYSCLNPQKKFGADVISRIKHTMEEAKGLDEMHSTIIDGINSAVSTLTSNAGLKTTDIYEISIVGNTTMMHFLLKLPAQNIAAAPFIPVATQTFIFKASDLGINITNCGMAVIVPSVAAYIGADTVSAVLASGMSEKKEISLLVDFGTNGEIVLGNDEWLISCSAAAGPAFEGANIRNGVGGINGAIDSFSLSNGLNYTTIGEEKPLGICGTGLVDIVSELYRTGIIDETGRLETDPDELPDTAVAFITNLTEIDGMSSFIIADDTKTADGNNVAITQKDVRELQNAKAAIAAGIKVLAKRAGIKLQDIEKVYLAGGFGTFINTKSALNIGLIPPELEGKIESIGNAAGIGAIEVLISKHYLKKAEAIKKRIKYIELSSCREFNDFFIDSMMFSEE